MKVLAGALLLLSSFVNAQCLVSPPPLPDFGWTTGGKQSGVGYTRICSQAGENWYGCNSTTGVQYWVPFDYNATPVFTADTLDTCTGYWIPTAAEVKQQQSLGITPEGFASAFAFGITAYLTFWFSPWIVKLARQMINKI